MSAAVSPQGAKHPAALFTALWRQAAAWSPSERATAPSPGSDFSARAEAALEHETAPEAYADLTQLLTATKPAAMRGQVLALMRVIDGHFGRIHPRGLKVSPAAMLRRPRIAEWLREAREAREFTGAYCEMGQHRLIARGPLLRLDRPETASSADSFEDRFRYLQVAPMSLAEGERPIAVRMKRISTSIADGIEPSPRRRRERVVFVPIAEAADDLITTAKPRGDGIFAEVQTAGSLDAAKRLVAALADAGEADLALAPELVMSSDVADQLGDALRTSPATCRLLAAGTGASAERTGDMCWNEGRVFNGLGVELWRQRKVWPAGWDQARAQDLGLEDPGAGRLLMEDNHAADEVVVADADGLGRCVILICQDLKSTPLASDLVRHYQPDWVITPILDWGVGPARWSHSAAYNLSELSQGRFLIVTSISFAERLGRGAVDFGLAMGPTDPAEDGVLSRAFLATGGDPAAKPRFATATWGDGDWLQTSLGASRKAP